MTIARLHTLIVVVAIVASAGCGPAMGGSGGSGGTGGAGGGRPPVEVVPSCGDGIVDEGEDCDDANEARGDGCHGCVTEQECIVAHGSGQPASFHSARVAPDRDVVVHPPLTLPASYDDADRGDYREDGFGRLTTCGSEHAYAVLLEAEQLAHLSFDAQGAPSFEEGIEIPGLTAVICEPELELLYVVSRSVGGELDVRSFLVEENGSLTAGDHLPVTVFPYLNLALSAARVATHPVTGSLWLTAYFRDAFTNEDISGTVRIESDATGALILAEPTRDIGAGEAGSSFRFNADGRFLVATGVDGDCTVLWRTGTTDDLPSSEDSQSACGYAWDSHDLAWFRDSDRFHYLLTEEVFFGGLGPRGGLASTGTTLAPTRARFMENLYDSALLVTVSAASGRLVSFEVGDDPTVLEASPHAKIAESGVRAIAKFPCIP